jgi:hypothetical protein
MSGGTDFEVENIKSQLIKYETEKHFLRIITENNIYQYYDLKGYEIIGDAQSQGTLTCILHFIQNGNFKSTNQFDMVFR